MRFFKWIGRKIRSVARAVKKLVWRRKVIEPVYFASTLGAAAYVLTVTLPVWLASFILSVVAFHEIGHYIVARRRRRDAWLPFFVPLYYAVFGATYVSHVGEHDHEGDRQIAAIGPTIGSLISAGFGLVCAGLGFMPGFWAGFWMLLFQLYSGTIGADGRKLWRATRAIRHSGTYDLVEPPLGATAAVV